MSESETDAKAESDLQATKSTSIRKEMADSNMKQTQSEEPTTNGLNESKTDNTTPLTDSTTNDVIGSKTKNLASSRSGSPESSNIQRDDSMTTDIIDKKRFISFEVQVMTSNSEIKELDYLEASASASSVPKEQTDSAKLTANNVVDYSKRERGPDSKGMKGSDSKGRKGSDSKGKKDSVSKERKGSASKERKGSVSKERKGSASKERKGSASKERKGSSSKERKGSASEERKEPVSKGRRESDSKGKKNSVSKERKGSSSKERKESVLKERKKSDSKERKGSDSNGRKEPDSKAKRGSELKSRKESDSKMTEPKKNRPTDTTSTKIGESKTTKETYFKGKKTTESTADSSTKKTEVKVKVDPSVEAEFSSSHSSESSDNGSDDSYSSTYTETSSGESSEEESDVETPMVKQNAKPFNVGATRSEGKISRVPGPGSYSLDVARRQIEFNYSFNGAKTMVPAVEIKCTENNIDRCIVCERAPVGDYWHFRHVEFMCRECMDAVSRRHMHPTQRLKIQAFRKIRDCSAIHRHEGTRAKIMLVDEKQIKKLQMKEAYLSQYY